MKYPTRCSRCRQRIFSDAYRKKHKCGCARNELLEGKDESPVVITGKPFSATDTPEQPPTSALPPAYLWHDLRETERAFIQDARICHARHDLGGRMAQTALKGNGEAAMDDGLADTTPDFFEIPCSVLVIGEECVEGRNERHDASEC